MESDAMTLVKDIVSIILMVVATVLCAALIIGLIKVFPTLRRSLLNLERVSTSAAEAAPDMVAAAGNIKEATAHIRDAAKDVVGATSILRLLGPAGAAANIASTGIGRLGPWIAGLFRR
jgi:hypothetical protein